MRDGFLFFSPGYDHSPDSTQQFAQLEFSDFPQKLLNAETIIMCEITALAEDAVTQSKLNPGGYQINQ